MSYFIYYFSQGLAILILARKGDYNTAAFLCGLVSLVIFTQIFRRRIRRWWNRKLDDEQ